MKLFSLFSGIGGPEKALKRLGIEYELVGYSEIDKYESKVFKLKDEINLWNDKYEAFLSIGNLDKKISENEKLIKQISFLEMNNVMKKFQELHDEEKKLGDTKERFLVLAKTVIYTSLLNAWFVYPCIFSMEHLDISQPYKGKGLIQGSGARFDELFGFWTEGHTTVKGIG